jgi:predicted nucleotidyltransferase
MWIVGSRARGDHSAASDLDLMVEFERDGISLLGFCRLENELSQILGMKVDLVEKGTLDRRVEVSVVEDAIPV